MVCDNKKVCVILQNLPSRRVLDPAIQKTGRDDAGMADVRSLSPCTPS